MNETNPEAEESEKKDDKDIADSFDKKPEDGKGNGGIASVSGALIAGGGIVEGYDRKRVFPSLTAIDERFVAGEQSPPFLPNGLTTKKQPRAIADPKRIRIRMSMRSLKLTICFMNKSGVKHSP